MNVKVKACKVCSKEKPLSEFYKDKKMADGHRNECKVCRKAKIAKWQQENPERRKVTVKEWANNNPEKKRAIRKAHSERFPEKQKAREVALYAIRSGKLIRGPCEICGATKVQAHHEDYSKPLDVNWLCIRHHIERHVEKRKEERIAKDNKNRNNLSRQGQSLRN